MDQRRQSPAFFALPALRSAKIVRTVKSMSRVCAHPGRRCMTRTTSSGCCGTSSVGRCCSVNALVGDRFSQRVQTSSLASSAERRQADCTPVMVFSGIPAAPDPLRAVHTLQVAWGRGFPCRSRFQSAPSRRQIVSAWAVSSRRATVASSPRSISTTRYFCFGANVSAARANGPRSSTVRRSCRSAASDGGSA